MSNPRFRASQRVIGSYGVGAVVIGWITACAASVALCEPGVSRGLMIAGPAFIVATSFGGLVVRQCA